MTPSDSICATLRRPHVFLPDILVVVVLQDVTLCLPISFHSHFTHGGEEVLNHFEGCPLRRPKWKLF